MTIPDENWRPEPKGILKIGALEALPTDLNEKRLSLEIPFDSYPYEELSSLYANGNWLEVTLSSIASQLKTWDRPKVAVYTFLGRLIDIKRTKAGTSITLDVFGGINLQRIDV